MRTIRDRCGTWADGKCRSGVSRLPSGADVTEPEEKPAEPGGGVTTAARRQIDVRGQEGRCDNVRGRVRMSSDN